MSDPQGSKATEIECEGGSAASCQTPTNDQGPDNHEAPVEKLPDRVEQPDNAYLVKMPSEIILSVTEHMDRQSLKSLALTSFGLHITVRAEFYRSSNYETFRLALEAGDFATIERCDEHNAAPADATWVVERILTYRGDHTSSCFDFRPIDSLMLAFERDKMTPSQCYAMLWWLVEKDSDMATACIPIFYWIAGNMGNEFQFAKTMKHIPHSFLRAFAVETDRAKLAGAAISICFLSERDFNFPREILVQGNAEGYGHKCRSRESLSEFAPLRFDDKSPMERMMRSACPPMVLEAFLKRLQRQGATLTSPLERCPESLRCTQPLISLTRLPPDQCMSPDVEDTLMTKYSNLVVGLYNDLLDPLIWRPAYNGEIGDIWERKLKLLDTYQGIDEIEKRHLLSILAVLRKIEDNSWIRRDEEACLRELLSALPDSRDESEILKVNEEGDPADRVHRFSFKRFHNPMDLWRNRDKSSHLSCHLYCLFPTRVEMLAYTTTSSVS
ncbi:uncharacterized protein NECHADRAFT_74146 [Fusarium vanettenii 77-13-4]|uniref:Uncharacterized protein n=1 Tax=Fusarium vanettenii (strain ATCC MYA-4622 / CBS 123669 / FGSC 9596 / NRRL 45880 / 77-13-4) TaxID=660122 RepID=C7YW13_FUSV7|nr:uncharacterized protein NECHADRAFT_74146 [Fusarium vanettenii 77-13-4]EEU44094.1 hypothetical protein NECHADRAFT_74146 [Fusarium vanettenii 77-13-4]